MRSLFVPLSALIAASCLICVGIISHHQYSILEGKSQGDDLTKYVRSAEVEIHNLELEMPRGVVARSFPKEENELKDIFSKGLKQLRGIEKQETDSEAKAAEPVAPVASKKRAVATTSTLAARRKPTKAPQTETAAARQRQLDASFAADNKENKALSGPNDVDALFKSLNDAPSVKPKHAAAPVAKKARTFQLAQRNSLTEIPTRRWGTVYNPTIAASRGGKASKRELSGLAAKEYNRWSQLAQSVSEVHDPTEDASDFHTHRSTAWWKWRRGGSSDQWWKHNHAGRGY
mmetsp:Transcript_41138/g.109892  ORF Transcript_41138/g.109892 Transcript_41138/m.109892 type:complete len:289 (-) Transcript_41138:43-909(-)